MKPSEEWRWRAFCALWRLIGYAHTAQTMAAHDPRDLFWLGAVATQASAIGQCEAYALAAENGERIERGRRRTETP